MKNNSLGIAQLNASFMATSLLGFILSIIFVFPESPSWGLAFSLTFLIMFISSLISMERGPVEIAKEYAKRERELEEKIGKEEKKFVDKSVLNVSKIRKNRKKKKRKKR